MSSKVAFLLEKLSASAAMTVVEAARNRAMVRFLML